MSLKLLDLDDNGDVFFFEEELDENGLEIFLSFFEGDLNGFLLLLLLLDVLPDKMLCTLLSDFGLPKRERERVLEDLVGELNIVEE
jgi:hypothetical protein